MSSSSNNICLKFQGLWFLLDKHHTPPLVGDEQMINYDDFLKVASEAGPKCKYVNQKLIFLSKGVSYNRRSAFFNLNNI